MRTTFKVVIALVMILIVGFTARTVTAGGDDGKVTLCHASGQSGTLHYETLTVGYPAAYGEAGHFYENGTPRAGHEDDYLGPCRPEVTTTTEGPTSTTTTTTSPTTSSTTSTSSTTIPTPTPFAVNVFASCVEETATITVTFGDRPDLDGQTGVLSFSTGGSVFLVFQSNQTVTTPYPDTTQNVNLIYSLGSETATGSVTYPGTCEGTTTTEASTSTSTTSSSVEPTTTSSPTTSTTAPSSSTPASTSTTSTSTTVGPYTSSSVPGETTTLPEAFEFGAAATVCVQEVPTIRIEFLNQFPSLSGMTGTLTMSDVTGNVVSSQPLTYEPGSTVEILYPGASINPDGTVADVPGWVLEDGFWVRDSSDEFLREGINLTYEVNPTATAFVTYPPESSACANPDGPFPPDQVPGQLPATR